MNLSELRSLKIKAIAHLILRRQMPIKNLAVAIGMRHTVYAGQRDPILNPSIKKVAESLAKDGLVVIRQRPIDETPKVFLAVGVEKARAVIEELKAVKDDQNDDYRPLRNRVPQQRAIDNRQKLIGIIDSLDRPITLQELSELCGLSHGFIHYHKDLAELFHAKNKQLMLQSGVKRLYYSDTPKKPRKNRAKTKRRTNKEIAETLDEVLDLFLKEGQPFSITDFIYRAEICTHLLYRPKWQEHRKKIDQAIEHLKAQQL